MRQLPVMEAANVWYNAECGVLLPTIEDAVAYLRDGCWIQLCFKLLLFGLLTLARFGSLTSSGQDHWNKQNESISLRLRTHGVL